MGKQDELAKMIYDIQQEGIDLGNFAVVPDGVFFTELRPAKIFAARHGKDLTQVDGQVAGWLAKDRT